MGIEINKKTKEKEAECGSKEELIFLLGTWKIKEETKHDENKFESMVKALQRFRDIIVSGIDGLFYMEVAVNKDSGEVYFQEHGSRQGFEEIDEYIKSKEGADALYDHVILDELFIFASEKNLKFCQHMLDSQPCTESACMLSIMGSL